MSSVVLGAALGLQTETAMNVLTIKCSREMPLCVSLHANLHKISILMQTVVNFQSKFIMKINVKNISEKYIYRVQAIYMY